MPPPRSPPSSYPLMTHLHRIHLSAWIASCVLIFGGLSVSGAGEHVYQKPVRGYSYAGCQCGPRNCNGGCYRHKKEKLVPPPFLPVVQSQAVRTRPPESDAGRMRLQVKQDAVDEPEPDRQPFRAPDRPFQKSTPPAQKASHLAEPSVPFEVDDRFNRLEQQVQALTRMLEEILIQQERTARALNVPSEH